MVTRTDNLTEHKELIASSACFLFFFDDRVGCSTCMLCMKTVQWRSLCPFSYFTITLYRVPLVDCCSSVQYAKLAPVRHQPLAVRQSAN